MSLRKIAGLLVVSGLVLGLIGGGVGASFFDNVYANQPVQVGTFSCIISDGGGGVISGDQKSVTYSTVNIQSSAPSSAPINFTVQNTGSIPQSLTVSTSSVSAPFSIINFPFAAVPLASSATHTYNTGLQWGTLTNANLGTSGTVTWTVDCNEAPAAPATLLTGSVAAQSSPTDELANLAGLDYSVVRNPDGSVEFTLKPELFVGSPLLRALTVSLANASGTFGMDLTYGSSDGTPPVDELVSTDGGVTYSATVPDVDLPSGELGIFFMVNGVAPDNGNDLQRFIGITAMSAANDWAGFDFTYANRLKITLP